MTKSRHRHSGAKETEEIGLYVFPKKTTVSDGDYVTFFGRVFHSP